MAVQADSKLSGHDALALLPRSLLIRTGPHDEAAWNYRGILGWIQRQRFRLIHELIGNDRYCRVLEIGYGSGVFAPELKKSAEQLVGADVHDHGLDVQRALASVGVEVTLERSSAEALPFPDASFDAVVAISSLEFVPDPDRACREIRRVLWPGGRFLVVTPGTSSLVDAGLRLLTGRSARDDFGDGRQRAFVALREHFSIEVERSFPPVATGAIRLYRAMRLVPRRVPLPAHEVALSAAGL